MKSRYTVFVTWLGSLWLATVAAIADDDANRPVFTLHPGTHTGIARQLAVDAAERLVVAACHE